MNLLLQNGAEVNVTDKNMWTPLHCAASQGHLSIVELLVDKGANVMAQTRELATTLHYISKNEGNFWLI